MGLGRAAERARNRVERLLNRRKQFRASTTRYDEWEDRVPATIALAAIRLWL